MGGLQPALSVDADIVGGRSARVTLQERAASIPLSWAVAWAAGQVLAAATLSTALSSWVYLAGKGLVLGRHEMDMGQDDLPPDSVRQVVSGLAASVFVWALLFGLALLICILVANVVYRSDRVRFRSAVRWTCAASVWLVVWASLILLGNAWRHDELKHPAAAVRAYAQLRQQGFQGSSAISPGPLEAEPLRGRTRLASLLLLFPIVWAVGLPSKGVQPRRRWLTFAGSIALWWLIAGGVARLLPWITIDAFLG